MSNIFILVPLSSIFALGFAVYLAVSILKKDEGTDRMKEIANAVKEGANAYLKRQYMAIGIFFALVFLLLFVLSFLDYVVIFVPFAFLTGGLFSALSGFCGMKIATNASARTTNACRSSLNGGLKVAFSSGTVMGLTVVGLGLLGIYIWFCFLNWYYTNNMVPLGLNRFTLITSTMLCVGMGASFIALFAVNAADPMAKPLPVAAVVFPKESRASVLLRTSGPS